MTITLRKPSTIASPTEYFERAERELPTEQAAAVKAVGQYLLSAGAIITRDALLDYAGTPQAALAYLAADGGPLQPCGIKPGRPACMEYVTAAPALDEHPGFVNFWDRLFRGVRALPGSYAAARDGILWDQKEVRSMGVPIPGVGNYQLYAEDIRRLQDWLRDCGRDWVMLDDMDRVLDRGNGRAADLVGGLSGVYGPLSPELFIRWQGHWRPVRYENVNLDEGTWRHPVTGAVEIGLDQVYVFHRNGWCLPSGRSPQLEVPQATPRRTDLDLSLEQECSP